MLKCTINTADMKRLKGYIHQLPDISKDKTFLSEVGMMLAAQAKRNLNESSADGITPYLLLKNKTIKNKRTHNPNPLIDTGKLRKSISYTYEDGNKTLYLIATNYAKHHQFGAPKANIPKRPIFSFRDSNRPALFSLMKKAMQRLFKNE